MKFERTEINRNGVFARIIDESRKVQLIDHLEVARQARANPDHPEWSRALQAIRTAKLEYEKN